MTESRILPSGLHRVKFQQYAQVPDLEEIKERCKVNDGQHYLFSATWMDENRIGHAVLAWKEYQQLELEGDSHESRN